MWRVAGKIPEPIELYHEKYNSKNSNYLIYYLLQLFIYLAIYSAIIYFSYSNSLNRLTVLNTW